jgi:hypothetical protein
MNHDFGLLDPMFEIDPDVQIVGVTPGPSVSSPTEETVGVSKSPIDIETLKSDTKVTSSQNDSAMTNTISSVISKTMKAGLYNNKQPPDDGMSIVDSVLPLQVTQFDITDFDCFLGMTDTITCCLSKVGTIAEISRSSRSDVCDLQEEEDEGNSSEISSQVPNSRTGSSKSCDVHGLIVVTLSSGKFWLMNVCDFKVLAEVLPPENDQFISSTYCSGKSVFFLMFDKSIQSMSFHLDIFSRFQANYNLLLMLQMEKHQIPLL